MDEIKNLDVTISRNLINRAVSTQSELPEKETF